MSETITIKVTADFDHWLKRLKNLQARAKVIARIRSAGKGNFGDCKSVGDGVSEMRIHCRSGYRIYFMQNGLTVYILLVGGTKATQQQDIRAPLFICSESRLLRWAVLKILMYAVYTPVFPLRSPCPRASHDNK
jgi:putative addiction module killer protein